MAKRNEDEIQQKLVELEVAMNHEQGVKKAEKPKLVTPKTPEDLKYLAILDPAKAEELAKQEEKGLNIDLYHFGGMASIIVGLFMVLSHIHVGMAYGMFNGGMGLMLLPLFGGIGWLIYNYKSRPAQLLTVSSLGLVLFTVISRMTLGFWTLSLLDLILLALPICAGVAFMAKANVQRRELQEQKKQIQ